MADTMKIWAMDALGRDTLTLRETDIPVAGPGEILVRVGAVSLNYRDKLVIETGMGLSLRFPFIPASDLAGSVVALGGGASRFDVGDRVISTFAPGWIDGLSKGTARVPPYATLGGHYPGVLAEYVAFPEDWFVRAPDTLDDAEASTLPVAGLTAWFALVEKGKVKPGETVLAQGTGGVAVFGLQIAKAYGANVIVTSGSPDKFQRVRDIGANHIIDRNGGDWVEEVYRLTSDRGVDHILEIAGGSNLGRSVEAVAIQGRISVIGVLDGFSFSGPAGPLLLKSPTIQGISVGHRRALEDFVRAIDQVGLKPVIDKRYGFSELHEALDHLDRGPFGKIVINVN